MPRNFDNWLRAYSEYTKYSESPDLFHFWTGVVTIAGALRRQVWIDQLYFQWTPNFYVVLVGPPGVAAKSTSARIGLELLESVPDVTFGPQSMSWQGLMKALQEAKKLVPFGEGEYLPMSCVTCSISELGTFLRPENGEMIDILIPMWDGQREKFSRGLATQEGYSIENPWLNVIACTTPAWLKRNFTEDMIGGGLVSRIVFVYGAEKRRLIAYPSEDIRSRGAEGSDEFAGLKAKLIEDLIRIGELKGEYALTPKAIDWGKVWYAKLWESRPLHMASDRYSGYIARKQTHIHKLAIVLAAAQRDELVIYPEDLSVSEQMITGLEQSMIKVFESIGVADTARLVVEILAYVRAHKSIQREALWRHLMPIMSMKDFIEASQAAVEAGYLKIINRGGKLYYEVPQTGQSATG